METKINNYKKDILGGIMIDKIKELKVYRDEYDEWGRTFDSGWNSAIDEVVKLLEQSENKYEND